MKIIKSIVDPKVCWSFDRHSVVEAITQEGRTLQLMPEVTQLKGAPCVCYSDGEYFMYFFGVINQPNAWLE